MDTHEAVTKVDRFLRYLNAAPARLAEATRGQPVRLLLILADPPVEVCIVIMSDGTVIRVTKEGLLGQGFTPQITLRAAFRSENDQGEAGDRLTWTIHDSSLTADLDAMRKLFAAPGCDP